MGKKVFVVDLSICNGCYCCQFVCKDEHVGNVWSPIARPEPEIGQFWLKLDEKVRGSVPKVKVSYRPHLCMHCDDAPCMGACAVGGAIYKREDGLVVVDPEKCTGCRSCVDACPYGMISWNEALETAQKCTLCAHLLEEGWKAPRCVPACPLRALSVVKCGDEEFERLAREQALRPLYDGADAPRVLYRNLYRYTTCFIAGALAYRAEGAERTASGADVRLRMNGELLKEMKTDFFGEFKIDRIPKNTGPFTLECELAGYRPIVREVTVGADSVCLDVMYFQA
jgi:Fe-S-cluster-containing dehydrogenase component